MRAIIKAKSPKRIVIKIGTSLLSDEKSHDGLAHAMLDKICHEIVELRKKGCEVLLVSSGAVRLGSESLKKTYHITEEKKPSIGYRQALSAIGQNKLMGAWEKKLLSHKIPVAQLLLTARDFRDRRAYLNIQHTLHELLLLGALPIINENDTIAVEELQFGENDLLSAACSSLFQAEYLLILTSVTGFLLDEKRVGVMNYIEAKHWHTAKGPDGLGRGGMRAKLRAAELCMQSGIHCAILPGKANDPLVSFLRGDDVGTFFPAQERLRLSARKKWILFACARGAIIIDNGACQALQKTGSSLLPVGVIRLRGHFLNNEIIEIEDENGKLLGRGLSNYSYREVLAMIGVGAKALRQRKLITRGDALVHRNNLILEQQGGG